MQATLPQPASRYSVRVEKAVEASAYQLSRDPSGLRTLSPGRDRRELRHWPWEDLTPPIGVGGGDPSTITKALMGGDAAFHLPSRETVHQLRERPATSPLLTHRALPHDVCTASERLGRRHQPDWAKNGVEVARGTVVLKVLAVIVRPAQTLRAPAGAAARVERCSIWRQGLGVVLRCRIRR